MKQGNNVTLIALETTTANHLGSKNICHGSTAFLCRMLGIRSQELAEWGQCSAEMGNIIPERNEFGLEQCYNRLNMILMKKMYTNLKSISTSSFFQK